MNYLRLKQRIRGKKGFQCQKEVAQFMVLAITAISRVTVLDTDPSRRGEFPTIFTTVDVSISAE